MLNELSKLNTKYEVLEVIEKEKELECLKEETQKTRFEKQITKKYKKIIKKTHNVYDEKNTMK